MNRVKTYHLLTSDTSIHTALPFNVAKNPFSIEPTQGSLEPGETRTFSALYRPSEIEPLEVTAFCRIPNWNAENPNVELKSGVVKSVSIPCGKNESRSQNITSKKSQKFSDFNPHPKFVIIRLYFNSQFLGLEILRIRSKIEPFSNPKILKIRSQLKNFQKLIPISDFFRLHSRPKNFRKSIPEFLTRRLSGFEILNNATLIFRKWLVSRPFGNIFHDRNFLKNIYDNFRNFS